MHLPLYPPRPRPRKKRKITLPPAPPVPLTQAQVLAVYIIDNTGALWVFNSAVTVPEDVPCAQLRIQTASGWQSAATMGQVGPYLIACDYDSGDLSTVGGDPWEILSAPVGIEFTAGVSLALPESGSTVR